jgi:methyl halide transferase
MDTTSNQTFWDELYRNNNTGWDMKQVSPPLKSYIDTLTDTTLKILIPGCGNAYEAEYLLSKGFTNVTLIDIAPTLVASLQKKFEGRPINVILCNFFEHTGTYDLILEQTFFCAIDPSLRNAYVQKCAELLNKNGKIAGLLFDTIFEQQGPPHGGTRNEYETLFGPKFDFVQCASCLTSIKPRLGKELFIELQTK